MKRFRSFSLGSAAFALAAVFAANVPAVSGQEGSSGSKRPAVRGHRMHGGFAGAPLISIALRYKSELNLAADQVANLEKIKSHYESQVTPLHQQLTAAEKEIATLTQQSPTSLIEVKAKVQEAEKYRSELRYLRIEALENGKGVLTAQQQEQLKTLARSRHENFRKPQGQPS
jgi:Spy/CpxP family protein refolding chaperone